MKTQTSIYLSEKDIRKTKELVAKYDLGSASELVRMLIDKEYTTMKKYEEILK